LLAVEGKVVLTDVGEVLEPSRAALVLLDMQNDLVHPTGWLRSKTTFPTPPYLISNVQQLLNAARRSGTRVMHAITVVPRDLGWSAFPASLVRAAARHGWASGNPPLAAGSWGGELVKGITVASGETLVPRMKLSAFSGTALDSMLRANAVQTVVLAGVLSHLSVDSTGRDASYLGYYVVVPEDGVASCSSNLHDAALKVMNTRFDCVTVEEIVGLWSKPGG
jgi:gluconolactonase